MLEFFLFIMAVLWLLHVILFVHQAPKPLVEALVFSLVIILVITITSLHLA